MPSGISAAFIDGDHDYEPTKNDFTLSRSLLNSGGYIGLHDVHPVHMAQLGSATVFKELCAQFPQHTKLIDCSAEGGPWDNYGIGVCWKP